MQYQSLKFIYSIQEVLYIKNTVNQMILRQIRNLIWDYFEAIRYLLKDLTVY